MKSLPIIDPQPGGPSCVTISGGLSDEQALIAQRMRALKAERRALRREPGSEAGELESREQELRRQWGELVRERDDAWRRKMKALGHDL
jgi:hypothetical protein